MWLWRGLRSLKNPSKQSESYAPSPPQVRRETKSEWADLTRRQSQSSQVPQSTYPTAQALSLKQPKIRQRQRDIKADGNAAYEYDDTYDAAKPHLNVVFEYVDDGIYEKYARREV